MTVLGTDVQVVHPDTGELLDAIESQPPEVIAEVCLAIEERQARLKEMHRAVVDDLRRRLKLLDRKRTIYGDFEVELSQKREYKWDAPHAETVLEELVGNGTLRAGEVADAITHEPTAHKAELNKIIGRLAGDSKQALEECRALVNSGAPTVKVVRSVSLEPALAAAQEKASVPPAEQASTDGGIEW